MGTDRAAHAGNVSGWPSARDQNACGARCDIKLIETGCKWRMHPKDFPPFTTVQSYFYRWRDDRRWELINHHDAGARGGWARTNGCRPWHVSSWSTRPGTCGRIEVRIADLDGRLVRQTRDDEACRRLTEAPGVGPVIATAVVEAVGDASLFNSGRCDPSPPGPVIVHRVSAVAQKAIAALADAEQALLAAGGMLARGYCQRGNFPVAGRGRGSARGGTRCLVWLGSDENNGGDHP